jgi:hypothetical protein
MRTLARYLLIFEVAVCYGPTLVMLALGVLVTPVWVAMVVEFLGEVAFDAKYRHATSLLEVGSNLGRLGPILLAVGGVLGFTGLFRVLRSLLSTTEDLSYTGQTRAFVLIGVGTLIYWVIVYIVDTRPSWSPVQIWPDLAPGLVVTVPPLPGLAVTVLPLIASGHIVYLARRGLFAHDHRSIRNLGTGR